MVLGSIKMKKLFKGQMKSSVFEEMVRELGWIGMT